MYQVSEQNLHSLIDQSKNLVMKIKESRLSEKGLHILLNLNNDQLSSVEAAISVVETELNIFGGA